MSQRAATIESLPMAFAMVKAMQAALSASATATSCFGFLASRPRCQGSAVAGWCSAARSLYTKQQ